jgi:hypothetical protein
VNLDTAGPAKDPYTIIRKYGSDNWTPWEFNSDSLVVDQYLGAKPLTAADIAAWKRDGSPTTFDITTPTFNKVTQKPGTTHRKVNSAAGPVRGVLDRAPHQGRFVLGSQDVTLAQLQALPSDPAALKSKLVAIHQQPHRGDGLADDNRWLTEALFTLVGGAPVRNETRAAAYRLLADLPGITNLGTVRDTLGRTGKGVAFIDGTPQTTGNHSTSQRRLIIDPATGLPLADESYVLSGPGQKPNSLISGIEFQSFGWSNDALPQVPLMKDANEIGDGLDHG